MIAASPMLMRLLATAVPSGEEGSFAFIVREVPSPYEYPEAAWSPYLAGALIGLLTLLSLVIVKKPVGASSAYAGAVGLLGRIVAPKHIRSLKYFQDRPPMVNWTLVFVIGAIIGAFAAAWTGGEITGTYLQDLWVARFGPESAGLRTFVALLGGMTMAFGARIAGGCTSGHGISGTLQLGVASWISVICFFIGGVATALLLYRL